MMKHRVFLVPGVILIIGSLCLAEDVQLSISRREVIGRIWIEGNTKTRTRVILTEMWLKPGDPYSKEAVEDARRRVMNLRYFRNVEIEQEVDEDAGVVNLIVRVKERTTWGVVPIIELDSGGDGIGAYGALIEDSNFLGFGKTISWRWNRTEGDDEETNSFLLSYINPQILYSHFFASVAVLAINFQNDNYFDDINVQSIIAGYRPTYETAVSLQLSIRKDDYADVAAGVNLPNDAQTTKIGLGINYSDVDYRIDSLTGVSAYLLVQEGSGLLGGDYDFSKVSSGVTYGRTMRNDHWLKLVLSMGIGDGLEDVDDGHEFFTVGGSSSIRGYPSGYQTGDQFVTFSAQYEIPIWRPAMRGFTGTVSVLAFLDAGSAWLKDGDDADPVAGAGVGVRAYVNELQSFALSVDVGYGFEEERFQTYLTFGSAL